MASSTKIIPLPNATTVERDSNYTNVSVGSVFFNTDTQSMEITRDGGTTWDEISTSDNVVVKSDHTSIKTNFVITNGGTGYGTGDFIKPSGGTAIIDANVIVVSTGGGGEIISLAMFPPDSDTGVYSSDPSPLVSNPVDTVTGSGSGAEITFELESSGEITANPENFDALIMNTPHGYLQLPDIPIGYESNVPMNEGGLRYLKTNNRLHFRDNIGDRIVMSDEDIPLTTKGDILVRDGLGSNKALPVSVSNDYVLTSDDSEALGIKWAASAGGASTMQEAYDGGSVVIQALGQKTEFKFSDESATQFEFSSAQAGTNNPLKAEQNGGSSAWVSDWIWTHSGSQFFGAGYAGFLELGSASSSSRTLSDSDFFGRITPSNATPITLTLPAGPLSGFGLTCEITQLGAGQITIQAPAGVELNDVDGGSFIIDNQYSTSCLIYTENTPNKFFISSLNGAKAYGGMYFKNNASMTTIVTQNVPVKVNATYLATSIQKSLSNDAAGTLTIGTIEPSDYYVECHIGARAGSTIRNNYTFYFRQNGVNNNESLITVSLDNQDTHVRFPTSEVLVNVSSSDTFELWVENNDGTQDIEVDSIYYTLKRA